MATLNGATGNAIPSANYYAPDNSDGQPFIRTNGPTRAAYQRSTGAELKLYTIVGMSDIGDVQRGVIYRSWYRLLRSTR